MDFTEVGRMTGYVACIATATSYGNALLNDLATSNTLQQLYLEIREMHSRGESTKDIKIAIGNFRDNPSFLARQYRKLTRPFTMPIAKAIHEELDFYNP